MAIASKVFNDGQLSDSWAAILTLSGEACVGAVVHFHNTSSTTTAVVWVRANSNSTERNMMRFEIPPEGCADLTVDSREDGDTVSAMSDLDATVNFEVCGGAQS